MLTEDMVVCFELSQDSREEIRNRVSRESNPGPRGYGTGDCDILKLDPSFARRHGKHGKYLKPQ
jgi:hypothetical protein